MIPSRSALPSSWAALAMANAPVSSQSSEMSVSMIRCTGARSLGDCAAGTGTAAGFNYPIGIAADANGNLYVGDQFNEKVRKIAPAGVVTTLAGNGAVGSADGVGSSATFYYPTGVTVDNSGNIYVTDLGGNTIRKVTSGGVVTTNSFKFRGRPSRICGNKSAWQTRISAPLSARM